MPAPSTAHVIREATSSTEPSSSVVLRRVEPEAEEAPKPNRWVEGRALRLFSPSAQNEFVGGGEPAYGRSFPEKLASSVAAFVLGSMLGRAYGTRSEVCEALGIAAGVCPTKPNERPKWWSDRHFGIAMTKSGPFVEIDQAIEGRAEVSRIVAEAIGRVVVSQLGIPHSSFEGSLWRAFFMRDLGARVLVPDALLAELVPEPFRLHPKLLGDDPGASAVVGRVCEETGVEAEYAFEQLERWMGEQLGASPFVELPDLTDEMIAREVGEPFVSYEDGPGAAESHARTQRHADALNVACSDHEDDVMRRVQIWLSGALGHAEWVPRLGDDYSSHVIPAPRDLDPWWATRGKQIRATLRERLAPHASSLVARGDGSWFSVAEVAEALYPEHGPLALMRTLERSIDDADLANIRPLGALFFLREFDDDTRARVLADTQSSIVFDRIFDAFDSSLNDILFELRGEPEKTRAGREAARREKAEAAA